MKVDPEALISASKAVLAAIRRDGRLPARLEPEDYDDLVQEGVLAALTVMDRFDPDRGSLRNYLTKPIARAQLKAAWKNASVGITGDHGGLRVLSTEAHDEGAGDYEDESGMLNNGHTWLAELDIALSHPDVAEEIEAFDHVWKTRYLSN